MLEYIDLNVVGSEDPLHAGLISLASLCHLSSVFICMVTNHFERGITQNDKEDILGSIDAIVAKGHLEVSFCITS